MRRDLAADAGDGGRIQAAAQRNGDIGIAGQTGADSGRKDVAKALDDALVAARRGVAQGGGVPIALEADAAGSRHQEMRRRQAADAAIERGVGIGEAIEEPVGQRARIRLGRHFGEVEQPLGRRGAGEEAAVAVVRELPDAGVVARGIQAALAMVPDGEGEIAEQVRGAVVAPALVGSEVRGTVILSWRGE